MKRIISVLLTVCMLCCSFSFSSSALIKYKATWTLAATMNNTSYSSGTTITVAPGDTIDVTFSLSNNYYTGPTCAQIFYSTNLFKQMSSITLNKNGRLYQACGAGNVTAVDWPEVAVGNREQGWPKYETTSKTEEFRKTHQWMRLSMLPDINRSTTAIKSVNEVLVTMKFKVSDKATDGSTGDIIVPIETMKTAKNITGFFFCGIYTTSDMLGTLLPYSDEQSFDCSKAVLKFKVSTSKKGDVNGDGKVNSTDALMTLQHVSGAKTLSASQKKAADVNSDGKINSTDALQILQYSVGKIKSF